MTQTTESDWTSHRKVWQNPMWGPVGAHILLTTSTCVSLSALSPQLSNWHDATVCNKKHFSIKTEWVFFQCAVSDTNGDAVKRTVRSLLSRVIMPAGTIPNAQIGAFGDICSVCFQDTDVFLLSHADRSGVCSIMFLSVCVHVVGVATSVSWPAHLQLIGCCSMKPSLLPED